MERSSTGRRPGRAPALLVALLLAISCGEREPGPDAIRKALVAADAVNPCILLTAEEIEQTMLTAPGEPEPETFEDAQMCLWPRADNFDVQLLNVVIADVMLEGYEAYLENSETLLGYRATAEQAQLVEGPGRFAVWIPDGDSGILQFFIDNHMIQIEAGPAGGKSALEVCRAFATIIDLRLP